MRPISLSPILGLAALALVAGAGIGQILRLDLAQMVARTDDAVSGTIVERKVIRIDHPVDGPQLYYTTLTVEGRSLRNGQAKTVQVTFPGGFVNETEGVFNSEAPSADDQKLGNQVVVFSKWVDNLGGGLACTALYASHGGLFRTFESRKGTLVQGRGEGYAIETNTLISELEPRVRTLAQGREDR